MEPCLCSGRKETGNAINFAGVYHCTNNPLFTFLIRTKKALVLLENEPAPHRYFMVHKPHKMVSQFISSHRVNLLGDLKFAFPEGTHAIGRLDNHSEGLLLLTTNKKVTRLLFESQTPHERTYLVLVRHVVLPQTLIDLQNGVSIIVKGGGTYTTAPCKAAIVTNPNDYFNDQNPVPIRPGYTWLLLTLTEGKYHQVRKMMAAIHHQCRRLIRVAIEDLSIGDLPPGGVLELDEETFFTRLKLVDDLPDLDPSEPHQEGTATGDS